MKIEWKSKPLIPFKEIKSGECFSISEICIYLKISPETIVYKSITGESIKQNVNAVALKTGNFVEIKDTEEVRRLKATVSIEE